MFGPGVLARLAEAGAGAGGRGAGGAGAGGAGAGGRENLAGLS